MREIPYRRAVAGHTAVHYGNEHSVECGAEPPFQYSFQPEDVTCRTCQGWLPIVAHQLQPDPDKEMVNSQRTENGIRLHDQHCAWCDCEEFVAVRYGSLHHLSERAARAVKAVVAVVDNPCCPECGSPEKRGTGYDLCKDCSLALMMLLNLPSTGA